MNKYKICVYAISKNEEKFVDRWMDSVSVADMVIVLDTGSTDKTVKKLKKRGAIVYEEKIKPWRFDVARNKAMSYIPEDIDICVSNDLDEVFNDGWRNILEEAWGKDTTRARYRFTWSYHSDGTPNKQFDMTKIHARNHYKWVHPVHEILEYSGKIPEKTVIINDLVLNHYPDPLKKRSQYLPLLELSAEENPTDPQTIFWLGREYIYNKKYDEAIKTLEKYLNLKTATWDEERSAAARFIAEAYYQKNNYTLALDWYYKAIAEAINHRESYLSAATFAYNTADWELLYFLVTKALSIKSKSSSYLFDVFAWNETFYDYGAIATYRLGLYMKSLEYAFHSLQLNPKNERLKKNLDIIQEKIKALEVK